MPTSPAPWLSDAQYAKATTPERVLAWADSQVGVREHGSNRGPRVELYQEVCGLGRGGGFPWCACFVYWCLLSAGVRSGRLPERGKAAAVRNWRSWARDEARHHTSPARGRLFYWLDKNQQGHIGFCLGPAILGVFRTIEGNTNDGGSREGDGVYKRTRMLKSIKRNKEWGFIDLRNL